MTDTDVGFGGTTPDPINNGDALTVHFCNPALAGQTITVTARDGAGGVETFAIELDDDGKGSTPFLVPAGWIAVILQHPSVPDHTVPVAP